MSRKKKPQTLPKLYVINEIGIGKIGNGERSEGDLYGVRAQLYTA